MTNKEAIEVIGQFSRIVNNESWLPGAQQAIKEASELAIKALQAAKACGTWIILLEDAEGIHEIQCPCCDCKKGGVFAPYLKVTFDKLPCYCENCGADMRGLNDGQ